MDETSLRSEIQAEYARLRAALRAYYLEQGPVLADSAYDALTARLAVLETQRSSSRVYG